MPAPRKLTLDDLWSLKNMNTIAVSPDGKRVAFVMSGTDKASNAYQSAIWLLQLDEQGHVVSEARQLTGGTKSDTNPAWAPDSKSLLFVSNREGEQNQLWLIDTDGGEARKLTSMLRGVNEAAWSPDGQWIAFTAQVDPADDDDILMGRKQLNEEENKKRKDEERFRLRRITTIRYRLDGRGLFDTFSQLFVMPAPVSGNSPVDAATIHRLTKGDADCSQPDWTPDSAEISVLSNRDESRHSSHALADLWVVSRETADARRLTDNTLGISSYSWSPDGQHALVVGGKDQGLSGRYIPRLWLVSRDGGAIQPLTEDFDAEATPSAGGDFGFPGLYRPQWSANGQNVYFLATERCCVNAFALDMTTKAITRMTEGERIIYYLSLLPGGQHLLIAQEYPLHPCELYILPLSSSENAESAPITHLYDQLVQKFSWSKPERMRYTGSNGDEIEGWLVRPVGAREGVRYPLLLNIHGGPHYSFGIGLDPIFQSMAAQGFAVFYCNPHGSTGRGEEFMRSVRGDWGGKDFQDIMLGVDECIARGIADPERLAVTGYSYGGFMTMFTIGHTDRFKAAVPMAGVSNLVTFVGVSDIGFWQVTQATGYPWDPEREAYFRERSPVKSAARVTTPTLFLHPENDLRCPIEQSEQFYMRLKMMGNVPVEFIRAPGAWHVGVSKPSQWLEYFETALAWFRNYIEIRPEEYEQGA
jgi:dipeptidyl aminopeptidase/acylaminoacyl peptidase